MQRMVSHSENAAISNASATISNECSETTTKSLHKSLHRRCSTPHTLHLQERLYTMKIDTSTFAVIRQSKGAARIRITMPRGEIQYLKFHNALKKYVLFADENYCEVNASHRDWAIEQLRYLYEGVIEYREYAAEGRCDTRCEEAEEDICVCVCQGEFHGGGEEWERVIGTTLTGRIVTVIRYWPSLDWRLMACELPKWVEERKGPHPVYALIASRMLPAIEEAS